jgi:hypothetical protein
VKKPGKVAWTAMGLTVIALDMAAALAIAPIAMNALDERDTCAMVEAGRSAARQVTSTLGSHASRIAGEGLIVIAKGASRLYGVMLSVTPAARAGKAHRNLDATFAPAAADSRPSRCAKSCPGEVDETPAATPARYYSQTL